MIIKLLRQVLHAAGMNIEGDCPAHSGCLKEVCHYLYSGGGTCYPNDVCAEELQECALVIDCLMLQLFFLFFFFISGETAEDKYDIIHLQK